MTLINTDRNVDAAMLLGSAGATRLVWQLLESLLGAPALRPACGVAAVSAANAASGLVSPRFGHWRFVPPLSLSMMVLSRELVNARDYPFWLTAASHVLHNSTFVWLFRFVSAGTLRGWKKILSPSTGLLLDRLHQLSTSTRTDNSDDDGCLPACSAWHAGSSCCKNAAAEFLHLFVCDLPYLAAVYLLPVVVTAVRRRQLPDRQRLAALVVDTLRSNFVIACLPVSVLHVLCLCRTLLGYSPEQRYPKPWLLHAAISSLLSAVAFHLERPSRKTALQAFTHWRLSELFLAYAADRLAARWPALSFTPRHQRVVFALILVAVLLYRRQHRLPFRTPFITSILAFLFPLSS